jgi:hypothetical protein
MSKLITPRRKFLLGLTALIAAPAIVQIHNIMPVRSIEQLIANQYWVEVVDENGEIEKIPLRGNNQLLASRLLLAATASA